MPFGSGTHGRGGAYHVEVNKGSLNVGQFAAHLNQMWDAGWELDQVFEQAGNTVVVFKARPPMPPVYPQPYPSR